MTKNRFIHLVRAYVREFKRGKHEYRAVVNHLALAYLEAAQKPEMSEEERLREFTWTRSFVEREYGGVDKGFVFGASD